MAGRKRFLAVLIVLVSMIAPAAALAAATPFSSTTRQEKNDE